MRLSWSLGGAALLSLPCGALAGAGYSLSPGYVLDDAGLSGILAAIDPSGSEDPLGADVALLSLNVTFTGDGTTARVLITDANDPSRWQVPEAIVPAGAKKSKTKSKALPTAIGANTARAVELSFTEYPFTLTLTRASDGLVLFSSSPQLVFKNQ